MKQEKLLSVAQVAEYLNVDKFTIYRLVTDGQIPAFKVGNQWRFKKNLIERWLRGNSNTSTYHRKPPRRKR
jgi:excisionase family DNA binding protein